MTIASRPLRIAHVVTLISPDGAYGGPTRVAINQAKALIERGHQVTILGGCRGFDRIPETYDGVPTRLFPATNVVPGSGFAGLFAPQLATHLVQHARSYDVFHIHLARDLVTLPAAWIVRNRRVPYVVQTHGMIDSSAKMLARPLDLTLTRPLLSDAAKVLFLTTAEARDLNETARGRELRLEELPNGVPSPTSQPAPSPSERTPLDVLFLARLHDIKRPRAFVEAAHKLADHFPNVTFSLVGPDEGEEQAIRALIAAHDPESKRIRLEGPLPPNETGARMRRSAVYVLPSKRESFGMSVLEAMSEGLPVVITENMGVSSAVREASAGIVVDGTPSSLADAIAVLLDDPGRRASMGAAAQRLVLDHFTMQAVVERLERMYRDTCTTIGATEDAP